MNIDDYLLAAGWTIIHDQTEPERTASYYDIGDLNVSDSSRALLSRFEQGLYLHQREALRLILQGRDVCLTTSTASGKSLVFYLAALERLAKDRESTIIAVYPLKALGTEQRQRWENALRAAGFAGAVGRIDGGVFVSERCDILRSCAVVTMTPDILHAWLLPNLSEPAVASFLRRLALLVIDEAHVYTGVFGSNSAYLYHRLERAAGILGARYSVVAASATIERPYDHLRILLGRDVFILGKEYETSPRKPLRTLLVDYSRGKDVSSALPRLMEHIIRDTEHQFLVFADSRKQAEYLAATAIQISRGTPELSQDVQDDLAAADLIDDARVMPYRSGYEESDRARIQEALAQGVLRGVVSTSALELGIDLPGITMGILVGVPRSATSLYQRIGRIGRKSTGTVLIIKKGDIATKSVFRDPARLWSLPFTPSDLYLENSRMQYIHALCLAKPGGEDDMTVAASTASVKAQDPSWDGFPEEFRRSCELARAGRVPSGLEDITMEARADPWREFPLRDIEVQYRIRSQGDHGQGRRLGDISLSQLLREAYPGAVYYYRTEPFRVVEVNRFRHVVKVRREKRYLTRPDGQQTLILPDLASTPFSIRRFGELIIAEVGMRIRDAVVGYTEHRGRSEFSVQYPIEPEFGIRFNLPRFARSFPTTGVLFQHPGLEHPDVDCKLIAGILIETFLTILPFGSQDIGSGSGEIRMDHAHLCRDTPFVTVFDQTYGSLHLTGALADPKMAGTVVERAFEIAAGDERFKAETASMGILGQMAACLGQDFEDLALAAQRPVESTPDHLIPVIAPGSKGISIRREEEFQVRRVFFSPQLDGPAYGGIHLSQLLMRNRPKEVIVPLRMVREISGISRMAWYDPEKRCLLR